MQGGLRQMSDKELTRVEIISKVSERQLTQQQAGTQLNLTSRQIRRLVAAYRQLGAKGLQSRQRGKNSNRQHTEDFKQTILRHVKKDYADFGPTLASEKLHERQQLQVNKETLRQWMIDAGFWKTKRRKVSSIHQQRVRRSSLGELVQIDGSPHDWFEGRRTPCCLLVFIDDATGQLLQLRFEEAETTAGYFRMVRAHLQQHGRPLAYYSDKHGVFRVNMPESLSGTGETQFGRAMRELGIELMCANSPQAKGRVERANSTLQDRLVKELRLNNISDLDKANDFLPTFIMAYNKRFAVQAASNIDAHRQAIPTDEALDLIFSYHSTRTVSKNLELSYHNKLYQIKVKGQGYSMRRAKVTVCEALNGDMTLIYKNKALVYNIIDKSNQTAPVVSSKAINAAIDSSIKRHKPPADHPWRQYEKIALKKAKAPKQSAAQA